MKDIFQWIFKINCIPVPKRLEQLWCAANPFFVEFIRFKSPSFTQFRRPRRWVTSGINMWVFFTGTVSIFVELLGTLDTYIFWLFLFQTIKFNFLISFVLLWARRLRWDLWQSRILSWLPLVSQGCRHVQMEEISVKFWLKTQKYVLEKNDKSFNNKPF